MVSGVHNVGLVFGGQDSLLESDGVDSFHQMCFLEYGDEKRGDSWTYAVPAQAECVWVCVGGESYIGTRMLVWDWMI